MQLETYLTKDDRIVLPVGSTEQHAYLSLETDNVLAERASVEAAEPLGVPVMPVLPYGVTGFTAYPGSPTLSESTLLAVLSEVVQSLLGQGCARTLAVNGHGGNTDPGRELAGGSRRGAYRGVVARSKAARSSSVMTRERPVSSSRATSTAFASAAVSPPRVRTDSLVVTLFVPSRSSEQRATTTSSSSVSSRR